ncbi:MAG: antibiotic biosynthesis monooxygenase [Clostridia bacterium]|nr:antibiotic biosynthesis monooxygenase [Clostridia bacterium]
MENFTILVIYKAKYEGAREEFVKELMGSGVLSAIRSENGCLAYEYYYSNEDKCRLVLYEKWESTEHQKIHMTQRHMSMAMEIKSKYIESAELNQVEISAL